MNKGVAGIAGLLEILSWARPHDSEIERRFCAEFLDTVSGMQADTFGNRVLRIGNAPVLWSCHVDTVAAKGKAQEVTLDSDGIASLKDGKPGMSLGADDGAGIWIMLNMIAAKRPGLYVFHRAEEIGCKGSTFIRTKTPELLDGIQMAVAFDRAHYGDVITHQAYGRTCSDAFAKSFAKFLNGCHNTFRYEPDDTGVYTDTNEYAGMIPECTNLSVGYHRQHGPMETLDVVHCTLLLDAMLKLDVSVLTVERDPTVIEIDGGPWSNWGRDSKDASASYAAMVEQNPYIAVALLKANGVNFDDFLDEVWAEDMFGQDNGYRPLAAA